MAAQLLHLRVNALAVGRLSVAEFVRPHQTLSEQNSYVDRPRLRRGQILFWRLGRVRSYVRPFRAAHMAAGPDEVRGTGPYQNYALMCALTYPGLPTPRLDRFAITSFSPSQFCGVGSLWLCRKLFVAEAWRIVGGIKFGEAVR